MSEACDGANTSSSETSLVTVSDVELDQPLSGCLSRCSSRSRTLSKRRRDDLSPEGEGDVAATGASRARGRGRPTSQVSTSVARRALEEAETAAERAEAEAAVAAIAAKTKSWSLHCQSRGLTKMATTAPRGSLKRSRVSAGPSRKSDVSPKTSWVNSSAP